MKNLKQIAASSVAILAAASLSAMPVMAQTYIMPDGGLFDAEYYAANNPDVVAAIGADTEALYQHYEMFGQAEGRLAVQPGTTETNATVWTPATPISASFAILGADGNYSLIADGYYNAGQVPYAGQTEFQNYSIIAYDLQKSQMIITTNGMTSFVNGDGEQGPAGTYIIPVSSKARYALYGGESLPTRYRTQDQFRSDLARYGGLGLSFTIKNGKIVEMGLAS